MHFELFLGGRMSMFPFHNLAFTLWLIMVDPCFTSRDLSFQEVFTFSTLAIQKPFAVVQMFLCAIL
jgi:hypothetical protein